jgi:hypothetical protein
VAEEALVEQALAVIGQHDDARLPPEGAADRLEQLPDRAIDVGGGLR